MRYEARAYGTRQEIIAELQNNLGAQRSDRRRQQSAEAIAELESGADSIQVGHIHYVVTDDTP